MKRYKVNLFAYGSVLLEKGYTVVADNEDEAIEKAKKKFKDYSSKNKIILEDDIEPSEIFEVEE